MLSDTIDIQTVLRRLMQLEEQVQQLRNLFTAQNGDASNESVQTQTTHPYVTQADNILSGEPIIKDTRTPVRAIVEHWKFGERPEEIIHKLPHLRLAQIFDALSYYDDNREQIEHYIALNHVPVDD